MKRYQPVVMEIMHEAALLLNQEIKFHRLTMQIRGTDTPPDLAAYERDHTELLVSALHQVTAVARGIAPELAVQTNYPPPNAVDMARKAVLRCIELVETPLRLPTFGLNARLKLWDTGFVL